MAITAAITLGAASGTTPITVTVTCTVTNGGSASQNVTGVRLWAEPSGLTSQSVSVECGMVPLGPGVTVAVAGSNGTLALTGFLRFFGPFSGEGLANPTSQIYTVGADVMTNSATASDAFFQATTANFTANAPTSH